MSFIAFIKQPWPWYTAGIAIAATMLLLIYFGKSFGFSANLRTLCTIAGAGKHVEFFKFDWKKTQWNLLFLVGAVIGGFIASTVLKSDEPLKLSQATINDIKALGINFDGELNPEQLFGIDSLRSPKDVFILLIGGLLIGFGSRYAGGCTSGHAISGLSNLQVPSLVAVIGFFIGGLIMTHFLLPIIL